MTAGADILVLKEAAAMVDFFLAEHSEHGGGNGELLFSVVNGEATVTGYEGEPVSIVIPDFFGCYPVTELRDNAFCNCATLKEICISQNVRKIGHHCFYACSHLKRAELPAGLIEIGAGCFCGCDRLVDIELPEMLKALPESCFRACLSLEELTLPKGLESIGGLCFSDCEKLSRVNVGESIGSIGDGAFFMCPELTDIYLPPACESIGFRALGYGCSGIELTKNDELRITGERGSAAQKYALENGFLFSERKEAAEAFASVSYVLKSNADMHELILSGAIVLAAFTAVVIRCFILHKRK